MLFLKQLVKSLVLSSAGLLHRTSHTKIFLLHAIFYLLIQCLPKVSSLHCIVPMPMSLSPVTVDAEIAEDFLCEAQPLKFYQIESIDLYSKVQTICAVL